MRIKIYNDIMSSLGRWLGALAICLLSVTSYAQNYERLSDIEADQYGDYAQVSADYQTTKAVRAYWVKEVQRLKSMKQLEFSLTGGNECVLKVTVPARVLFAQNDSILLSSADGYLRPLLRLVKGPDAVASMIIAGYSDNNGSDNYIRAISGGRARQVHRWFARQGVGPASIHSYGFGNKVPRNNNETMGQREKNRRVSIYLVPNKKMLKAAKRGNL